MSREKQEVLQKDVDSLLRKGAIEKVKDSHKGFFSNLFLESTKDGGLRPVINLSGLNLYIKKKTFRMAYLKFVSQTGRLGGDDRLEGRLSARPYRVGASTVPSFLVEKKQTPVRTSSFWSQLSATDLHTSYLAFGDSVQGKRSQSDRLLGRFSGLRSKQGGTHSSHNVRVGHPEERRIPEKSQEMSSGPQTTVRVPRPTMELEGVFLPQKKLDDFKRLGRVLLSNPSLALAQKFLGKAVFARRAVRLGRLLLRPLQMSVIRALRSGELILNNESRLSIRWWTRPPTDEMDLRSYTPQLSMTVTVHLDNITAIQFNSIQFNSFIILTSTKYSKNNN